MQKMYDHIKNPRNNQNGFTLAELMMVVAIIAILVAIAVPIYASITSRAEERTCQANQRIIEGAVRMWLLADTHHEVQDVTMDELKSYWKNDPAPLCPLGSDAYQLDKNGRVKCPYGHDHY